MRMKRRPSGSRKPVPTFIRSPTAPIKLPAAFPDTEACSGSRIDAQCLQRMSSLEPIRLQKFIAEAGVCSRRAAEALIAQGEVWVNGKAASLGQKITPGVDKVTVSG